MDNSEYRKYIYAFLSRIISNMPDARFIKDLKNNSDMLDLIGESTKEYFEKESEETIYDELNMDYTSMFILNTQPVESFVLDAKNETLVGLQNPVMAFYFNHGFEINMNQTEIVAPDHLSIELGFMQTLIHRDEVQAQKEFIEAHLISWVIPYMIGMKDMARTPFFKDICDFIVEFLCADYEYLNSSGNS
ncbi:MAG: molecular chaperone TorD family protein [Campylobacterota bacterium]|nr:molecular chaperone TorD family protein [Campylobacterota bacterium]